MTPTTPFRKIERLTKPWEYRRVYKDGKLARGAILSIYILPIPGKQYIRLGISIGSKAAKRAVSRNKAKRVIREWFRGNAKILKPGSDIVVAAKKGAFFSKASPRQIRQELFGLVKR